jgi:hypothetical protein
MNLRRRLQRLESLAAKAKPPENAEPVDLWAEVNASIAYATGAGPAPPARPCPAGVDPARWVANDRLIHWMAARARGDVLSDDELRYLEAVESACAKAAAVHERELRDEAERELSYPV